MAGQIPGFHAGLRGQTLDYQRYRLRGKAACGEPAVPVDAAEQRSAVRAEDREPSLHGPDRAGGRCGAIRNSHPSSLPFLVGLGAADIYDQTLAVKFQIADVEAYQLGAAEGAGEAR